jgi:hypothetical protein
LDEEIEFLMVVKLIYEGNCFPQVAVDPFRFGPNLLLHEITRHFIKIKRISKLLELLHLLAETNP